jgi:hypothetical protein
MTYVNESLSTEGALRSRVQDTIPGDQVHSWALAWLLPAKIVKDFGPKTTAENLLNIVLRAASQMISLAAACRDLADAPCDQAVFDALAATLPKGLRVLEGRCNDALTNSLPGRWQRRAWRLAIDYHCEPYYGQPLKSKNELCGGPRKNGTHKFHVYATACLIDHGQRYTLALTEVRRHETMVTVLKRLVARIRQMGLKIKHLLVDRAFFTIAVISYFQAEKLPFVMPVVLRGRKPKPGKKATGLQAILRSAAGWYTHTLKNKGAEVKIRICVGYRTHKNRKDGKQVKEKLLFGAWKVNGSPCEIRELDRKRFGIETSYRQRRQAQIYTCTREPRYRLLFIAMALILRNLWVWIHATKLGEGSPDNLTLHLELLRFKRMLDWIANESRVAAHATNIAAADRDSLVEELELGVTPIGEITAIRFQRALEHGAFVFRACRFRRRDIDPSGNRLAL